MIRVSSTTAAVALAGALLAPSAAFAQSADCTCAAPVVQGQSVGRIVQSIGDVKVMHSTGLVAGAVGSELPASGRVLVGNNSSAIISITGGCQISIGSGSSASLSTAGGRLCVSVQDSMTTAQVRNGPSLGLPEIIFGGALAGAGAGFALGDEQSISE